MEEIASAEKTFKTCAQGGHSFDAKELAGRELLPHMREGNIFAWNGFGKIFTPFLFRYVDYPLRSTYLKYGLSEEEAMEDAKDIVQQVYTEFIRWVPKNNSVKRTITGLLTNRADKRRKDLLRKNFPEDVGRRREEDDDNATQGDNNERKYKKRFENMDMTLHNDEMLDSRINDNGLAWEQIFAQLQKERPEFAEVIKLCEIDGYDDKEVAELLKISHGTVKSRKHRGKKHIIKICQKLGFKP